MIIPFRPVSVQMFSLLVSIIFGHNLRSDETGIRVFMLAFGGVVYVLHVQLETLITQETL
jgi:hypothetical protein